MEAVFKEAIDLYGADMQLNVAIEEMSELIKEICKFKRGMGNEMHIAEEMADVKIILEELEIIFDNSRRVETWYEDKKERLKWQVTKDSIEKGRGYEAWKKSFGETEEGTAETRS